ncbi:MAG: FtsK/SpoIIIE domain-containing protein [Pirellulaceae bacterium]|nr:FtsK/SpoIIIE domain-containing protein [Pirellulaceae bacterium]
MNRRVSLPSILNDRRKKQLIRALEQRLSHHRGSLESTAKQLATDRRVIEDSFQASSEQLANSFQSKRDRAITDWDERLEEAYYHSDRATLASLRMEAKRKHELKESHQHAHQQENKSHEQTRHALDQQFEEVKPKPAKQLERFIAMLASRRSEADDLIEQFRSVMIDRSVGIPSFTASDVECNDPLPDTMQLSMDATTSIVASMKRIADATKSDFVVRLSGSITPWIIGILPGILVGLLLWKFMSGQPYLAVGVTIGVLFIVPIVLILALMPLVKRRMLGPYRLLIKDSERLAVVSQHGQQIAEAHCRSEQAKLLAEYKERLKKLDDEHRTTLANLDSKLAEEQLSLRTQQSSIRCQAALDCEKSIRTTDQKHTPIIEQVSTSQKEAYDQHLQSFEAKQRELEELQTRLLRKLNARVRTGTEHAQAWLKKQLDFFEQRFPSWESEIWTQGKWSRSKDSTVFPIGSCELSIEPDFQSRIRIDFDLLTCGALIIEADREHRQQASGLVQSILARAMTSLPMGNLHCTIIDPEGLGKDYAWLMQLADADPRLVGHRIWTQHNQIAEQLSMLAYQNEEIIQQRLRDRYANILEYNDDAGPMTEPLRLVVWSNFPFGLDETSWKSLCVLLASGARCGIGVIITIDPDHPWPVYTDREKVLQAGLRLQLSDVARVAEPGLDRLELQIDPPPSPTTLTAIVEHCTRAAMQAGRIEVPFETIKVDVEEFGRGFSSDDLVIPLGVAGVGRTTHLRLGHGTAQHVLIAGKTGSGKSSLLHTLITSAALKYAPDQLRMVLLDFKKGVEFQIYAQKKLPHAEIIGIESRREFGLSSLEYLDRVMQRRGELFRQAGVQDIPSWHRVRPEQKMPRLLVVIDEFQEMFVEDDKLAQQSAMLLDRVVRQGRSFGIHMVLASQTLGGSYSLPRTTLAQMAVRIALQCDGADAMMILGEDNLAATRLRHSGQAIYNDAGGRIESNQPFQVAYLTSSSHSAQLSRISPSDRPNDPSTNLLGRQIIFEGHRPAVWDTSDVQRGIDAIPKIESGALPLVLGESLSIEPTVTRALTRQAGRHFAIVGSDDALAANLIGSILRGWLHVQESNPLPKIYYLDGSRTEDRTSVVRPWLESAAFFDGAMDGNLKPVVGDLRDVDTTIATLVEELEQRIAAPDEPRPSVVLFVVNLARFRELRHVDEFSFGSSGDSAKMTTDAAFAKLLREGASVGMHVICWSDSWGTLSRFISRQGLRDLEVRALMQMSSNDSNQLIDSSAAHKLEPHAMIYFDETEGKIVKFRPYQANVEDSNNAN